MNEYTLEGLTIVDFKHGTLPAAFASLGWIDFRYVDEIVFLVIKDQGAAGSDASIKVEAREKGKDTTITTLKPHYIVKKQKAGSLLGVGFVDAAGELDDTTHVWTNKTNAEQDLILCASVFPETLVRHQGKDKKKLSQVRVAIQGSAADATQGYTMTALCRLKDPEPIVGNFSTQRVK